MGSATGFGAAQALTPVGSPTQIELADINTDGFLDLVYLSPAAASEFDAFISTTSTPFYSSSTSQLYDFPTGVDPTNFTFVNRVGFGTSVLFGINEATTYNGFFSLDNNGSGSYSLSFGSGRYGPDASSPIAEVFGKDINGDGSDNYTWFSTDNGGELVVRAGGTTTGVGSLPTLANINNDGFLDLVSFNGGGIQVRLHSNPAIEGNFQAAATYATTIGTLENISVIDLTGDGRNDIYVASAIGAALYVQQADGTFQLFDTKTSATKAFAYTDYDNDGDLDVLRASGSDVLVEVNLNPRPANNISGLTATAVTATSVELSWQNGSGAKTLLAAAEGTGFGTTPTDRSNYTADNQFGNGQAIAGVGAAVYNGAATEATIEQLVQGQQYTARGYSYSTSNGRTDGLTAFYNTQCTEGESLLNFFGPDIIFEPLTETEFVPGQELTLAANLLTNFQAGNEIIIQLSAPDGSFATPTELLRQASNQVWQRANHPYTTSQCGTGYRYLIRAVTTVRQ